MTWDEFFASHPDFAARRAVYSATGDLDADNTQTITVGDVTIRRTITTRPRSGSDYYSQHRRAHGDFLETASDAITVTGPEDAISALRLDAGDPRDEELWQRLVALANRQPRRNRRRVVA